MPKKQKVDKYHRHEALDRTYLMICNVEDFLSTHPAVKANKKAKKLIKKAGNCLAEAYQELGYEDAGKTVKELANNTK